MVKRQSKTRRAARLVKLGATLAGSYLAYQIQRPFVDEEKGKGKLQRTNAKLLREQLQELRGPVMKLGQALSMQTHLLSPESISELTALQMQAPPMHSSLMRAQFKSAMGKLPEEVFRWFDSDLRLQLQVAFLQRVAATRGGKCQ